MNYDWLEYEKIQKAVYPNLLAELKESGYSICTISEFMELGRCQEDDKAVWSRLVGNTEFSIDESLKLATYFGVDYRYLFSHNLAIVDGKSVAYWRWYDWNLKMKTEIGEKL